MAFFQSNLAIGQRSKYDSAAFGPEVASDIIFRGAHRGDRSVTFTVSESKELARVHSSAGAALLARLSPNPGALPRSCPRSFSEGGCQGAGVATKAIPLNPRKTVKESRIKLYIITLFLYIITICLLDYSLLMATTKNQPSPTFSLGDSGNHEAQAAPNRYQDQKPTSVCARCDSAAKERI